MMTKVSLYRSLTNVMMFHPNSHARDSCIKYLKIDTIIQHILLVFVYLVCFPKPLRLRTENEISLINIALNAEYLNYVLSKYEHDLGEGFMLTEIRILRLAIGGL